MRRSSIAPGDIVCCDRLGRRFWARVGGWEQSRLSVVPITRNVTYYSVRTREVLEHYARRTRPDGRVSTRAIREEDLIAYERGDAAVLAIVVSRRGGRLRVLSVDGKSNIDELSLRQVTGHYARRGRSRSRSRRVGAGRAAGDAGRRGTRG